MRIAGKMSTFLIAIGQMESSLSREVVRNNDGERLDEKDLPCGFEPVIGLSCWEVIRGGGDGASKLG